MTEDEIKKAITYANQIDPRIQMNIPTLEIWTRVLHAQDPAAVHAAIGAYHERPHTGFGQRPVIEPSTIRRIISQETEREEARQSALEAESRLAIAEGAKRERVRRSQTPEYQRAMIQGAIDHLADLERRGIIEPDQQARLDHYRETGAYKAPNDGRGMR